MLALGTSSGLSFDAQATRDPWTGQLRTGAPDLLVFSRTWFASVGSIGLLTLALGALGLRRGGPRAAATAVAVIAAGLVCAEALKWGLGELMPLGGETEHGAAASWPSVHATVGIAVCLSIAALAPARWRPAAIALAVAYPSGMGVAAMLEGWHYPSDVVAGHLLGAALIVAGAPALAGRAAAPAALGSAPVRDPRVALAVRAGLAGGVVLLILTLVDTAVRHVPDRVLGAHVLGGTVVVAVSAAVAVLGVFGLRGAGVQAALRT